MRFLDCLTSIAASKTLSTPALILSKIPPFPLFKPTGGYASIRIFTKIFLGISAGSRPAVEPKSGSFLTAFLGHFPLTFAPAYRIIVYWKSLPILLVNNHIVRRTKWPALQSQNPVPWPRPHRMKYVAWSCMRSTCSVKIKPTLPSTPSSSNSGGAEKDLSFERHSNTLRSPSKSDFLGSKTTETYSELSSLENRTEGFNNQQLRPLPTL